MNFKNNEEIKRLYIEMFTEHKFNRKLIQKYGCEIFLEDEVMKEFVNSLKTPEIWSYLDYWVLVSSLINFYGNRILKYAYNEFEESNNLVCKINIINMLDKIYNNKVESWLKKIIIDKNNPIEIRCEAIKVLKNNKENISFLKEIYETEKGNIKQMAFNILAYFNVEEIINSILKRRFKQNPTIDNIRDVLYYGSGKICTEEAIRIIDNPYIDYCSVLKIRYNHSIIMGTSKEISIVNKLEIKEYLSHIVKNQIYTKPLEEYDPNKDYNTYLILNIMLNKEKKYKNLIKELYIINPEYFNFSYLILILSENRTIEDEEVKSIFKANKIVMIKIINFITECFYSEIDKKYHYKSSCDYETDQIIGQLLVFKDLTLTRKNFEKLISLVEDSVLMKEYLKLEIEIYNKRSKHYLIQEISKKFFPWISKYDRYEESQELKNNIINFCLECFEFFPAGSVLEFLIENLGDEIYKYKKVFLEKIIYFYCHNIPKEEFKENLIKYKFTDYMFKQEKESLSKLLPKEINDAEDIKLKRALEQLYLKLKKIEKE